MKERSLLKIALTCIFIGIGLLASKDKITAYVASLQDSKVVNETPKHLEIHFCPEENCYEIFRNFIKNTSSLECAIYELDNELASLMAKKKYKLVTDNRESLKIYHKEDEEGLMHNKFCVDVANSFVITGSFNPKNASTDDVNNLIIIQSKYLAENYKDEFDEMWNGIFKAGNKVKYPLVKYGEILIENYFCPEDNCKEKVINVLNKANKSIYFMHYILTDNEIANVLKEKSNIIDVKGILEERNAFNRYSKYEFLKNSNAKVKLDNRKALLHSKIFIVDEKIVITGSYNPTYSANKRNDENLLIFHSKEVAKKYLENFQKYWQRKIF